MNDVLLRYSQGLPVLRVEDRGKTWAESSRNGCVCGGVEGQWPCIGLLSFLLW